MKNTKRILSQDSQYPCLDSNRAPLEYSHTDLIGKFILNISPPSHHVLLTCEFAAEPQNLAEILRSKFWLRSSRLVGPTEPVNLKDSKANIPHSLPPFCSYFCLVSLMEWCSWLPRITVLRSQAQAID